MANDKLMNHTQGETIITKLTAIADSLDDLAAVTPAKLGMGIATCDTPASTAAKTAALANFALVEGAPVSVKFTYANTAANATLNINNTGAKPIIYKDAAIGNDVISAGDTCTFIYTTNTYKITNIDTLTGPGSGTVRSVGASTGLKTDQTGGAAINTTGSVKLDLKSETPFEGSASTPVEIEDKIYPVVLDADGHPAVSVPGTEYTQGDGINISENNVITNTGVFDVTTPTSSDTSATNGDIKVTKKVVNNGVTSDSVTFVKPKGINDPAFKALDSSTSGLTADDNHVPTSKTVQDAIDTALASASVYKGTIAAFNDLPTSTATVIVRKGWYYRVSTAWAATTGTPATHVGDIIIAEIDSPSKSIDGTNWSLLHNEANTDANVAQSPVSTNANYEVLFSGSADNTAHTEGTGKDSGLTYNPSTNKLTVSGEVSGTGFTGDGVKTSFASQTSDLSDKKVPSEKLVKTSLDEKVAGPSSVTGDTIVLFDSTTGKLVKSSSKTFESSYSISDDDTKIPTSKGIRENAATYGKLGTYSADTSRTNITNNTTIKGAVKQLEYREELNKSNILYAINTGVKNIAFLKNGTYQSAAGGSETTFVVEDGVVTITSTTADTRATIINYVTLAAGTYIITSRQEAGCDVRLRYNGVDYNNTFTINSATTFEVRAYSYTILTNATITPLLCVKSVYDQDSSYQPPALSNYDLTRLESEDRASLAEVVDSGAKNILTPTDSAPYGDGLTNNPNLTCTNNGDGTYTLNGSTVGNGRIIIHNSITSAVYGGKMLSGCPNINTGSEKCRLSIYTDTGASGVCHDAGQGNEIPTSFNPSHLAIYVFSGNTFNNVKFYPMICTKAAFGVSNKFVPYRPNYDLVCSNLFPTAYSTPTKDAAITSIDSGGYCKIGNLVVVSIRCTVGTAIVTYGTLFTGLPAPIYGSGLSDGAAVVVCATNRTPLVIDTYGNIKNFESASIPTGILHISAIYLCK